MRLRVDKQAAQWYKEELELQENSFLRFYVRYGGFGGIIPGFSLGVSTSQPSDPIVEAQENGITFYIEQKDEWYFEGHNLTVTYNEKMDEPEYTFDEV